MIKDIRAQSNLKNLKGNIDYKDIQAQSNLKNLKENIDYLTALKTS